MTVYKHIFFDLDQTIWDFETNSRETLLELSVKYDFASRGIASPDDFLNEYFPINERMWHDYRKGLVDKHTLRYGRFEEALKKFHIDDKHLAGNIANDYTFMAPLKTNMFPHALQVLDYLKQKYTLHIITNGFEEVQHIKIKNCRIDHYFEQVITSERAGFKKPDKRIFEYSMNITNSMAANSLMIGDNMEADIIGARDAGIHQVYFNPSGQEHSETVTYEIRNLKELMSFL